MTNEFEILNAQFIGYGNPKGKYWFGGIEGAAPIDKWEDVENFCKELSGRKYMPDPPGVTAKTRKDMGSNYTKIYGPMAKIVLMHRGGKNEVSIKEVNDYVDEELFMEYGDIFQINLYPLGKPNVKSWEEKYNEWFKFKDKDEYLIKVRKDRFPKIKEFVEDEQYHHPKRIIVCFGIMNLEDYKNAFGADLLVQNGKFSKIYTDQYHRLLVVYSPAYGNLSDQDMKDTVQIMREFGD